MVPCSLFILASSVCRSLLCLMSALTQGGEGSHLFRLTCSAVLWGGGTLQTSIPGVCGECSQHMKHTGSAPAQACVLPGSTPLRPRVRHRALSKVGPLFHALLRSKLLRFSGAPQGNRLGWACVLGPSQVQASQATRCVASALSWVGHVS